MTTRWAIVAFLVGACVGILMTLPASIFVPDPLDERIEVYGSVFSGQASLSDPVSAVVSWDLERLPILWLQLSGRFTIDGDGLDADGELSLGPKSLSLEGVNATIHPRLLNRLLRQEGVALEKVVTASLDEVIFSVDRHMPEFVSGVLSWPGGRVQAQDPWGKPIQLNVPALRGLISTSSKGIELVVSEEGGPEAARFLLDYDGIITEKVLTSVQSWANVAFSGSGDEVLFKRQRRLYGRQ